MSSRTSSSYSLLRSLQNIWSVLRWILQTALINVLPVNFHIKGAYLNWLSINAFASKFAFSSVNYALILLKAWNSKDAFLQRFSICFLNLNLLWFIISPNFTVLEQEMSLPLILSLKGAILLTLRTINWNLPESVLLE